jgi:hypothetical protein
MSVSKKSKTTRAASKKSVAKKPQNRPMNALQEKLIKLFVRPNGATLAETVKIAKRPALMALRMFERRGYKTSVVKKAGEPTRYLARAAR